MKNVFNVRSVRSGSWEVTICPSTSRPIRTRVRRSAGLQTRWSRGRYLVSGHTYYHRTTATLEIITMSGLNSHVNYKVVQRGKLDWKMRLPCRSEMSCRCFNLSLIDTFKQNIGHGPALALILYQYFLNNHMYVLASLISAIQSEIDISITVYRLTIHLNNIACFIHR